MYKTRLIKNHDGMLRFLEIYKPIVVTLEELTFYDAIETSKASQLYTCIITSKFIISMITAITLFLIMLGAYHYVEH